MDLSQVTSRDLERLSQALASGHVVFPLTRLALSAEGLEALAAASPGLNAVGPAGARACIEAVLAERRARGVPPELVWTGPETRASAARDTAVVLRELLGRATARVLVAGFVFDHAREVLGPLHSAMVRGVRCRVFADAEAARDFWGATWPFGAPFPEVYAFEPAAGVFASLHAKCVVVDGRWVYVTSANFTDRGQTRNIEVGVLLDDGALATALEAQFSEGPWFRQVS